MTQHNTFPIRGIDESLLGVPLVVARIATANPLVTPGLCGHVTLKQCDGPRAQILEVKMAEHALWLQLMQMAWKRQTFFALREAHVGSDF